MLVNLTVKVFEDIENYFLYTGFLLQKFTHRMDCDLCCTFFREVEFSGGNTAESHTFKFDYSLQPEVDFRSRGNFVLLFVLFLFHIT